MQDRAHPSLTPRHALTHRHTRRHHDLRRHALDLIHTTIGMPGIQSGLLGSSGRGVLLRLLLGETLDLLLRDDDLILALALAAPSGGGGEPT